MAIFLTSNELNTQLENLFEFAEQYLILISPYIKLHQRYASVLKSKKDNYNLKIIVVFGKNEDDLSKSMRQVDFEFFKEFPNIEIRYEKRLHAKYYANETSAILTSMNLYNFSQDNNIEAGVLTDRKGILGQLTRRDSLESEAFYYFERVIEQSDLLFSKVPKYENTMLGLSKRYTVSEIKTDKLSNFFSNKMKIDSMHVNENFISNQQSNQNGYCIRTGIKIPFNIEKPLSYDAFKKWNELCDSSFPEKFCHFSGEPTNGETSVSKPILKKNWKKAKEIFEL